MSSKPETTGDKAGETTPQPKESPLDLLKKSASSFRKLTRYLKPYRTRFTLGLVFGILYGLVNGGLRRRRLGLWFLALRRLRKGQAGTRREDDGRNGRADQS